MVINKAKDYDISFDEASITEHFTRPPARPPDITVVPLTELLDSKEYATDLFLAEYNDTTCY